MTDENDKLYWHTDTVNISNRGQHVIERTYFGDVPDDAPRFFGLGMLLINMQAPNGQTMQRPHEFEFPIDATNHVEAFEKFDEACKAGAKAEDEKIKKQFADEQKRILVPGSMPGGGFVGGKKLRA